MKLFLIILFFMQQASANIICNGLFLAIPAQESFDAVNRLESLEADLQSLLTEINLQFGQNTSRYDELSDLVTRISEKNKTLENLLDRALEGRAVQSAEVEELRLDLLEIDSRFRSEKPATETPTITATQDKASAFKAVLENPKLVTAEKIYTVVTTQGEEVRFLFSRKLTEGLFVKTPLQIGLKNVLSKISIGIFGSKHRGEGIIKFDNFKGVVELKALGGGTAAIRIYGYFEDGVVNFVHWSKVKENSQARSAQMARSVMASRTTRSSN